MFYANEKLSFNQFVLAANINKKKHFDLELLNSLFYSNSKKQFNFAYTYSQFLFSKIIDDYSEKIIINMIMPKISTLSIGCSIIDNKFIVSIIHRLLLY